MDFSHVARFLQDGLDLLFPPSCVVCKGHQEIEAEGMICKHCLGGIFQPVSIPAAFPVWACGEYTSPLRELIHRAKFSADPIPLSTLVLLLTKTAIAKIEHPINLVTSVPASPKRLRQRGMDLPGILARRLAKHLGVSFSSCILQRTRDTTPQTALSREARLKNLTGVFSAADDIGMKHLLVVDDVVTTGATATAIFEALSPKSHSTMTFLALARTPEGTKDS